ncbi:MAG: hypothetical protein ACI379_07865 [Nocardioides sp.]|uniref:hypothetical protein n=1 Tax=Nocardioides sp. TaxID=35761 RepID=UPI003F0E2C75
MRSNRRGDAAQGVLWGEVTDPPSRPRLRRTVEEPLDFLVLGEGFGSRGWGPGTVAYYAAARRAARGEVAVVREGERLLVGVFALELGRPVLRTDKGATWLGPRSQVVGVVRMVEPPLEGLAQIG